MSVEIQRPPGPNVGVHNPGSIVYVKGNETTDGSIRVIYSDADDLTRVQKRTAGVWNITRLQLANEVIVQQASDLSGTLASDTVYLIDGSIDMGSQSITVPQGGLHMEGLGFGVSTLLSTENNYTMFIDDGVFSGDLFVNDMDINLSGTGTKLWDLDNDENLSAVECTFVNFLNLKDLGSLTKYRQGLWFNVAFINCVSGRTYSARESFEA